MTSANASRPPPSEDDIRTLLADQIDRQHKSVGMVVGIITPEGRRVISHGGASRDGPPVDGDTAFEIASVTKVFTALLLAELQWEFIFDWNAQGRIDEMLFGARRGQPMLPLRKR